MVSALGQEPAQRLKSSKFVLGRAALSVLFVTGLTAPALTSAMPVAAQPVTVSFSTAAAAPADSLAYVVSTLDNDSEQWKLADSLLDRAGFGEAIDQTLAESLTDENGNPLPLDAFMGGEIALVIDDAVVTTLTEESMGSSGLDAMLGEVGDESASPDATAAQGFAAVLDARAPDTAWAGIRSSASEGDAQEVDYEGTAILYSAPEDEEDEGMAAAKVGKLILVATTPEDLHPLIDTLDGRAENISTLPEFATAQAALPQDFLTFAFMNSAAKLDIDYGPAGPAMQALVKDAYSAMTLSADQPGFRLESAVLPPDGGTLEPGAAPFESTLAGLAPENAMLFMSSAELGKTGVLDALGAVVLGLAFGMGDASMAGGTPEADASPEDAIAAQYEGAAAMLGINLQTDLFHQLVGEYGGWITADAASEQVSGIFASQVADPAAVKNTLRQLSFLIQGASGGDSALSTRTVGNGEVYVMDLGDAAGSTFEFGVIGDTLVLGSGDAVSRMAGEDAASLASGAQYQEVMGLLPTETNGSFYVDLVQALPLMETASEQSDDFGLEGSGEITDASDTCANYATQVDAQTAYDAGEPDTFDLDQDFDGEACEDYFTPAAEEIDSADSDSGDAIDEAFANVDYSAIKALGVVGYEEDGLQRSSALLLIAE